jgi:hypothetical protein
MGASKACTYPGIGFTDASPLFYQKRQAQEEVKARPEQAACDEDLFQAEVSAEVLHAYFQLHITHLKID